MKIYAPVKDFNGLRNNVRFVNGVGETSDPSGIEWFKNHGYTLEKCDESYENPLENVLELISDELAEPTLEEMTPNELRQWAIENGYGSKIRNTRNKEKLLEILRG